MKGKRKVLLYVILIIIMAIIFLGWGGDNMFRVICLCPISKPPENSRDGMIYYSTSGTKDTVWVRIAGMWEVIAVQP